MILDILHFSIFVFGAISLVLLLIFFVFNYKEIKFTFIDGRLWLFYTKVQPDHIYEGSYREVKHSKMLIDFNNKPPDKPDWF